MQAVKEPIKIRTKKLENGMESIYLDIYTDGKRKKEYLKLYLLPDTTKVNKQKNKETLTLVNSIKAKKLVELNSGRFDFENRAGEKMLLMDYMKEYLEKQRTDKRPRTARNTLNTINYMARYVDSKNVKLKDVDKGFIEGFIAFMNKQENKSGEKLKQSTIRSYYAHLVAMLNRAVRRGYIIKNPCSELEREDVPRANESTRTYLTMEEVKRLIDTPCKSERVKKLFLFSCFTGLRIGDIKRIRREDIVKVSEGIYQIEIIQEKTGRAISVPLTDNAMMWIKDEKKDRRGKVFPLTMNQYTYNLLDEWAKTAGITKKVTFHVGRHTYATLLLHYGADVYTVSKLLGHTNVKTTQIYAKVMDENKRKAVNLIPSVEL